MSKYRIVAVAVLRGLLRFTKVGFQTHVDRQSFLDLVQKHLYTAHITYDQKVRFSTEIDKVSLNEQKFGERNENVHFSIFANFASLFFLTYFFIIILEYTVI